MALRHARMSDYVYTRMEYGNNSYKSVATKNQLFKPNTEDTYIAISGYGQEDIQQAFVKCMEKHGAKFIYISPKAINTNYKEEPARNILMVFEFDEVK